MSVGIISSDPDAVIRRVENLSDESLQMMLLVGANVKYLEFSLSASRKYVSQEMLDPEGKSFIRNRFVYS